MLKEVYYGLKRVYYEKSGLKRVPSIQYLLRYLYCTMDYGCLYFDFILDL